MTTPAQPESALHRFTDWLHSSHTALEQRISSLEATVAELIAKDGAMVEKDIAATEAVAAQDLHDAGTVVTDAEKAAGG